VSVRLECQQHVMIAVNVGTVIGWAFLISAAVYWWREHVAAVTYDLLDTDGGEGHISDQVSGHEEDPS
jgi:hypothetical protein